MTKGMISLTFRVFGKIWVLFGAPESGLKTLKNSELAQPLS
jgi:hypothetical protein